MKTSQILALSTLALGIFLIKKSNFKIGLKKIVISLKDIKHLKKSAEAIDELKEKKYIAPVGYGNPTYGSYTPIIEKMEKSFDNNVRIIAKILNISSSDVVDMVYDLDFANYILKKTYK